jgi:nifR3 family TIM-barrel protein
MAAITNPPFRLLCREMGAGMVVTEMFAAQQLASRKKRNRELLDIREDEHPVSVQLLGHRIDEMVRAAINVEESGADMVDINMGCPMRKVVHSGNGAALLRHPKAIYELIKAMTEAVSIPITAKIRMGWEDSVATDIAKAIEDAGGAAIAIHGRTRSDMFEGHPDLDGIAEVKRAVSIPVIGNGDVVDADSAQRMLSQTGCDGVMVARGCMGNPWAFREIAASFQGLPLPPEPALEERREVVLRHVHLYADTYGEFKTCREIRKHLLWYFKDTPAEAVLKQHMQRLESISAVEEAIEAGVNACRNAEEPVVYPKGLRKHPNRRQLRKKKQKCS